MAAPTVRLTFREGLRIEQMVAEMEYLEANPVDPSVKLTLDVAEYYQLATNPPATLLAQYPWLKLPAGASLEGFLFPATYNVDPNITALGLIEQQLAAFVAQAPPALFKLTPDQIYQTVEIASLVEPEAVLDSDRPLVAGVYVNRLEPQEVADRPARVQPHGQLRERHGLAAVASDGELGRLHVLGTGRRNDAAGADSLPAGHRPVQHVPSPRVCPRLRSARPERPRWRPRSTPTPPTATTTSSPRTTVLAGLAFAHTNAEQIANEKKYGYIK